MVINVYESNYEFYYNVVAIYYFSGYYQNNFYTFLKNKY